MVLRKPIDVDRFTGYRYYEYDQLASLYRILALKDLGFSLEEIGRLLEGDLSTEQMRGMLKLRQAEIRQRRLARPQGFRQIHQARLGPFIQALIVPEGIISIEGDHYRVEYETTGFIESATGKHIHFFYNNISPDDAGAPGSGPWMKTVGPRPFTGAKIAERPPNATKICVLVANPNHHTIPGSGNCVDLPPPSEQ